ncbi:MAG: flagellar biosynthesis protein FlhA [Vampirovibrionales bacterium]|nr:flagellar biosynthesis protein FlhA [Vampirovibrionales bacterium]
MAQPLSSFNWRSLLRHNDILLAVGLVLIVAMMLIPLPALALDILLTINIALAVTILLVTVYTRETLEYSTFPTILLVSTLFRLGLNVSSTRLILGHGEAGQVIHSFGAFVIGGNYVVGMLIFIILVIINFIVITNGAGRVSEVAARFTLDAMPGKQLSIDADLNAGLIDEASAKKRRVQIQREADFYGTMDGASKFVKGDAIAGIIIAVVNIIGGLIVGVLQMKMGLAEAASTFTILTVGDGLVTQIPALLISSATGILVTRVSETEDSSLGDDIGSQMFGNPKVVGIVAAMMLLLAIIPGLPTLPFIAIGGIAGFGSFWLVRSQRNQKQAQEQLQAVQKAEQKKKAKSSDNVMDLLQVEAIELEMGYRLVPLIEVESGGDLLERIAQIRRQIALEFGLVLPSVRVRDNLQLGPNQYQVKLRGVTIDRGEIMADRYLAMNTDPDNMEPPAGSIATREPAFGLPALWIRASQKEEAEDNGFTVVSASAVVSTHLTEILKRNLADILNRGDVLNLLDNLKRQNESLVSDLIPDLLSSAQVHVILQHLLRERVSIRDLSSILEALGYHARVHKDPDFLAEQCRMALSRAICKQHQDPDSGDLPVITLAPEVEEQMAQGLMEDGGLALSPAFTQQILNALGKEVEKAITATGVQPVVLCNAQLRRPFKRLIERSLPQISVLSYNEIGPSVKVNAVGSVRSDAAPINAAPAMA